jgi:hypothetical protein
MRPSGSGAYCEGKQRCATRSSSEAVAHPKSASRVGSLATPERALLLRSAYARVDHQPRRVLADEARAAGQALALTLARLVIAIEIALMLAVQAARFGAARMPASGLQLLPADIGDLLLGNLDSGGVGRAWQEPESGKASNDNDRSQRSDFKAD